MAFPLSSRPRSKNSSEIGFAFGSNPSSVVESRTYVCAGAHASVRDRICMCRCEPVRAQAYVGAEKGQKEPAQDLEGVMVCLRLHHLLLSPPEDDADSYDHK